MSEQVKQAAAPEEVVYKKRKQLPDIWRRFCKNKRAVFGLVLMVVIILAGIFAPFITSYEPTQQNLREAYQTPSAQHWFGTDSQGRDLYSRVIYGIRTSLLYGIAATAISLVTGGLLGAIAGYYGGKIDEIIMRFMDILLAIPSLLLAISLVCPWFGRQVLTWVVDMTCVGAAVGFTYTCATATIMSKKDGLKGQTIISAIGTVLAAFFIILSFIPGSPGFLSVPSFIILGVWIVLGIIFWVKIKDRFLHGRWEGVDVEHILMSKMTEAGTIDSYNKNQ